MATTKTKTARTLDGAAADAGSGPWAGALRFEVYEENGPPPLATDHERRSRSRHVKRQLRDARRGAARRHRKPRLTTGRSPSRDLDTVAGVGVVSS
jgi:hypothetical protein